MHEIEDVDERGLVGVAGVAIQRGEHRAVGVQHAAHRRAVHVFALERLVAVARVEAFAGREVDGLHAVVIAAVVEREHQLPVHREGFGPHVARERDAVGFGSGCDIEHDQLRRRAVARRRIRAARR